MANEFVARKGLISLADSTISGSLFVHGSVTASNGGGYSGSGAQLYDINANNISAGTINNARLPAQIDVTGITGSLFGTASQAITASFALSTSGTVQNALTASYVEWTGVDHKPAGIISSSAQVVTAINGQNVTLGVVTSSNLLVTGDMTVLGTSSIVYVTSSVFDIGNNRVVVNVGPGVQFGGISVNDSGSATPSSGSLYWDSLNNRWLYQEPSGSAYNTAIVIGGPQNAGALGSESGLTAGIVPKAQASGNITDSQISDNGTVVGILGDLKVTGSISGSSFSGDGSGLTNVASTLSVTGSNATSGSLSLKTQGLIVSGAYNITTEVAGQTLFIGMATGSNLSVNTGTSVITLVPTASYTSAFFDYVVNDGTNYRAGTVTSVWLGNVAQFTDVSTTDIGNTAGVVMAVDVVGANARLKATVGSNNWVVKTLVRAL